jgi:glucose/arabinose dehydrogenase
MRFKTKYSCKVFLLFSGLAFFQAAFIAWPAIDPAEAAQKAPLDWRSDWAVAEGFALEIDTEGYSLPTAIAFVPQPGTQPKDPLYFVTELRGRVKVITNDRSVNIFAEDFFRQQIEKELPEVEGETGLAGICLAPEKGYVFVTFAYTDEEGVLRNNVMRFDAQPGTFSLEPSGQLAFTGVFAAYESAISHQIGSCQVAGDFLYVSVGDGRQVEQSQAVDSLLGKVLRMTFDGKPAPGNPFFRANDDQKAADYVWAYGFRNPFGLKAVGDRIFVADNGSDIDRFVEIQPGEYYFWDGTDWSIGARADVVIAPDIAPVQVDYAPGGFAQLPDPYSQSFFIAASRPDVAGVFRIGYSLEDRQATGVPEFFLRYRGENEQVVSGVAVGPDGLYFVPILPDEGGRSAVFKAAYDPDREHPYLMTNIDDPVALMWDKGCFGCHRLGDEGGTAGPALDQQPLVERLEQRLDSEEYIRSLEEVDRLERDPFRKYKEARADVLQAEGKEKLRLWMIYHIMEPRFDNPNSQMPNLGLSRTEAMLITDYLLQEKSFMEKVLGVYLRYLPAVPMPRHLFFAFGLGWVAGALFLALGWLAWNKTAKRERRGAGEGPG